MIFKRVNLFIIFFIVSNLIYCSKVTESNGDEKEVFVALDENTIELTDNTIQNIILYDDNEIELNDTNEEVSSLEIGDNIIISPSNITPYGALVKIDSISTDRKHIKTKPTTLWEAIDSCFIKFNKKLAPVDFNLSYGKNSDFLMLKPTTGLYDFNYEIDNFIAFDFDGNNNTIDDQIVLNGAISFNLDIKDFIIEANESGVQYISITLQASVSSELYVTSNIPIVQPFEKKTSLLSGLNPFFVIPVGGVYITVELDVVTGVEGQLYSTINGNITDQFTIESNITYQNGNGKKVIITAMNLTIP